jgi:hypothetical protein
MPLSLIVATGYNFSDGEKVTYPKLNLLGTPSVTFTGELSSAQLSDGAVTTGKLEQGININSKIDDHNLSLTKLEAGTQGQILYYNADGDLVKLAPGTDGQFLRTKGSSAAPEWASQAGLSSVPYTDITTNGNDKYLTTNSSGAIEWINKPTVSVASVFDTSDLATIVTSSPFLVTQPHGLGTTPEHVVVTVRCTVDDSLNTGYAVGDEILLSSSHCDRQNETQEFPTTGVTFNDTNVILQMTQYVKTDLSRFYVKRKNNSSSPDYVAIGGSGDRFTFRIRVFTQGYSSSGTNAGPLTSELGYYFTSTSSTTLADILTGSQSEWTTSFSHELGSVPKLVRAVVVCTTNDSSTNYVAGDEIDIMNLYRASSGGSYPAATVTSNASNVRVAFAEASSSLLTIQHKTSANWVQMSSASKANFKLKLYAWK